MSANGTLADTLALKRNNYVVERLSAAALAIEDYPATSIITFDEIERAKAYGRAAQSPRTRHEYARDWAQFAGWCEEKNLTSRPANPTTIARYAAALAHTGRAVATIRRALAGIAHAHAAGGYDSPNGHKAVQDVMRGIARSVGVAQSEKTALTADLLPAVLLAVGERTLRAVRDRAVVLVGFAGGFRRSEIAGIDLEDLQFDGRGVRVNLRSSKTDQQREGRVVALPYVATTALCPVRALKTWLADAEILGGPVFRSFGLPRGRGDRVERLQDRRISGRDVARIVQRYTAAANLFGDYGGHSLRAGFITSAAQRKVPEVDVQRVTGHRSVAILRRYVRRATIFEDAPLNSILG